MSKRRRRRRCDRSDDKDDDNNILFFEDIKCDCIKLWSYADKQVNSDIDFGEDGPMYVQCILKKLGAVPGNPNNDASTETSQSSTDQVYKKYATNVRTFTLS